MKFQQIFESLGILVSGVLFYSYTYSWFPPGHPQRQRWWTAVLGLSFGGLAIAMMIARIEIAPGVFIDARLVPVALIGLFEGWKIGLLAGLVGAAFRVSLGEPGMWASVAGLALMGLGAGLVQRWAGGADQVGPRHAFAVTVIALSITSSGLAALGTEGMSAFSRVWISYLAMLVAASPSWRSSSTTSSSSTSLRPSSSASAPFSTKPATRSGSWTPTRSSSSSATGPTARSQVITAKR